jgi:hypothetical protein
MVALSLEMAKQDRESTEENLDLDLYMLADSSWLEA